MLTVTDLNVEFAKLNMLRGRTPESDEARAPEAMRQRPAGTPTCGPLPSDMRANRGICRGSPAPRARPMKRRRWLSPPR
jgi:hypothetical protein